MSTIVAPMPTGGGSSSVQTGVIQTQIPSRLDRLPWSRFHWRVVVGLGFVWILDGLEVLLVGAIGAQLTNSRAGVGLSTAQIGDAASIYIVGAVVGALFFGYLTDRFGRKRLFMITLGMYVLCTGATAFAFAPWYFFLFRALTGFAIGGEYSAINSAIDELIPARVRGRVDLIINGSFWIGGAAASGLALFFLSSYFPIWLGWRLAYGLGVVLGLGVLLVRRNLPESPRWLFIHGRAEEAERIVDQIEGEVSDQTHQPIEPVDRTITIRQRKTIGFIEIARTAFRRYPTRSALALALFVGQAFIYNGVAFNLGTLMTTFFGVAAASVPIFTAIYALSNFAGPLTIGRLFDTIGRKPMIAITYVGSAAISLLLAVLFAGGSLGPWTFIIVVMAVFFLASAGASSAYLTASEIFPMETRAMAIAFFYAVGTGVGGITGPLIFSHLIASGSTRQVDVAFILGAAVMTVGGVAALLWGVKAEGRQLEDIAEPLTMVDAEATSEDTKTLTTEPAVSEPTVSEPTVAQPTVAEPAASEQATRARLTRAAAAELRARAAGHDARAEELAARGWEAIGAATPAPSGGNGRTETPGAVHVEDRVDDERVLAQITRLEALALDEVVASYDALSSSSDGSPEAKAIATRHATAARHRAEAHRHEASALGAPDAGTERVERSRAAASLERARAQEQLALAEEEPLAGAPSRRSTQPRPDEHPGTEIEHSHVGEEATRRLADLRADMHRQWATLHERLALAHDARSEGDELAARRLEAEAEVLAARARRAGFHLEAAEHRAGAAEERHEEETAQQLARRRRAREEAADVERRVRERLARRRAASTAGYRRFRPGPGRWASGGPAVSVPRPPPEEALDSEIDALERALAEHGALERRELARMVGARYWGPGAFREALRLAVDEGGARRLSRTVFAPATDNERRREEALPDG